MKYIVEITKDVMVKRFVDDDGREYTNTWIKEAPGSYRTLEKPMDEQMEATGKFDEELLEAIYQEDLFEIWKAIRQS